MIIAGAIVAGLFGIATVVELIRHIMQGGLQYAYSELFILIGFCAVGVTILRSGIARKSRGERYRKYLAAIGEQRKVSLEDLAKDTGYSMRKVREDLGDMLEEGVLPPGRIHRSAKMLILNEEKQEQS